MRPTPLPTAPGQESVWDYPRPPRVEPGAETVEVVLGGIVVARTKASLRVLETSHPPTYYLPREAFLEGVLRPTAGHTYCEWKGQASYADLVAGTATALRAAWTYPDPVDGFAALLGHYAVMPGLVEECRVDGERVLPQQGGFYGGWITDRVVGPFKGRPGSWGW